MIKKILLVLAIFSFTELAFSITPQELLKAYEAQSAKASPVRGEQLFNTKHGKNGVALHVMKILLITTLSILLLLR